MNRPGRVPTLTKLQEPPEKKIVQTSSRDVSMEPENPIPVHERELVTRHTSNLRGVNSYEGLKDGIMDLIRESTSKILTSLLTVKKT